MSSQPFRTRFGLDAEGNRVQQVADPQAVDDAVNLRTLRREAGIKGAARIANLPNPLDPNPAARPQDGQAYLIKADLAGQELDRLVVFDAGLASTGGVAQVQVVEPAADRAAIAAQAGAADAGLPFDAAQGTGALLTLTANADGTISGTVDAPGTGYQVGDTLKYPAGSLAWGAAMTGDTEVSVLRLTGTSPTGGWRFVNLKDWLKQTAAAADHAYGQAPGDFQSTVQQGSEELKVWTGTTWKTLYSTKEVEAKIATLSLFEGTVKQVGGAAVPGAIDLAGLPNLLSAVPADVTAALAKTAHYWTWVGQAGYVVQAADPNGLGRDIAGATLQVGDWVQLSNRGTTAAPDLRWVHIGGDLLAKSRADVLYGLADWTAGNYEKGALVNYLGSLWRSTTAVVPTDTAPGTPTGPWAVVPLTAGVKNVPTDNDLPALAPASDVYLVLNSTRAGARPALFSFDPGAGVWIQLGGGSAVPLALLGGSELVGVGTPVGSIMAWPFAVAPAGWLLCDGAAISQTAYPELFALLATNPSIPAGRLPDFRGAFLRGAGLNGNGIWGDAARVPGSYQEDATKRPNTPFGTDAGGVHHHTAGGSNTAQVGTYTAGVNNRINAVSGGVTGDAGAHSHTITTGGDPETRPKNFAVNWVIKARDLTVAKKV